MRCIEAERNRLTGPTAQYYSLNRGKNVDPLYDEPSDDPLYHGSPLGVTEVWGWFPAFDLVVTMEYGESENKDVSVRDEGQEIQYDATIRLAHDEWMAVAPVGQMPKEGDVCYVFEKWWDVVRAGRAGYVVDTSTSVGWVLGLKHRDSFTPDRKIP
jgi:hypothetical protein